MGQGAPGMANPMAPIPNPMLDPMIADIPIPKTEKTFHEGDRDFPKPPDDPELSNDEHEDSDPFRDGDFFTRDRTGDKPPVVDTREKYPRACLADDYGYPLPDQGESGMCLEFASTSILEHFVHLANPDMPPLRISPWQMLKFRLASNPAKDFNRFTDEPLNFRDKLVEHKDWLPKGTVIPKLERKVLFEHDGMDGRYDQVPGGISLGEFNRLKEAIRENKGPVLFEWRPHFPADWPLKKQYWHANVCFGYDDKKQVLLCRDSAMGKEVYHDGKHYRNVFEMPYSLAVSSGKHAAVYSMKGQKPATDPAERKAGCIEQGESDDRLVAHASVTGESTRNGTKLGSHEER